MKSNLKYVFRYQLSKYHLNITSNRPYNSFTIRKCKIEENRKRLQFSLCLHKWSVCLQLYWWRRLRVRSSRSKWHNICFIIITANSNNNNSNNNNNNTLRVKDGSNTILESFFLLLCAFSPPKKVFFYICCNPF